MVPPHQSHRHPGRLAYRTSRRPAKGGRHYTTDHWSHRPFPAKARQWRCDRHRFHHRLLRQGLRADFQAMKRHVQNSKPTRAPRTTMRWHEAIILYYRKLLVRPNVERVDLGWKERGGRITAPLAVKIYV